MNSPHGDRALPRPGCPIRRSPDQHLLSGSPELIAASHVLRRLLAPRHSPCALSSLTMFATGRPLYDRVSRTQRLGELPRACSRTDGYPSRLSKNTSRERFASRRGSTPRSPLRFRWEPQRASRVGEHDGADGDRTHDLRLAKPALSQLSYSPEGGGRGGCESERARGQARMAWRGRSSLPSHVRLSRGAGPVALVWMLSSSGLGPSL